jgi:plastocyanin
MSQGTSTFGTSISSIDDVGEGERPDRQDSEARLARTPWLADGVGQQRRTPRCLDGALDRSCSLPLFASSGRRLEYAGHMRRSLLLVLLFALCTVSTASAQSDGSIRMNEDSFDQTAIHVAAGSPVTWANSSAFVHTVTADDGTFDSSDVTAGSTFQMIFTAPGTYPYYCQYHGGPGGSGMSGLIVVE